MNNFLGSLSRQEKAMVVATAALIFALAGYFFIFQPLSKQLDYNQGRIPAQRELLSWIEQSSQKVQKIRALHQNKTQYTGSESAPDFISKTAKGRGLGDSIKRVESTDDQGVKVWIEEVVFDDIISWIALLQEHYGLTVVDISIDKAKDPGFVNIQVLFKEGKHDKS
jgi:general secretion pathway protein M